MFRLAWSTDVHLNLLRVPHAPEMWARYIQRESECDALVLTGDISEALTLHAHLSEVEEGMGLERPTYFVLGNHDYYDGSFESSQRIAEAHAGYLEGKVVQLTETIGLIGQEGWYDAYFGKPYTPKFGMNDWKDIADYANLPGNPFYNARVERINRDARTAVIDLSRARSAAQAAAAEVRLVEALERYPLVILATHVPPFEGATWHEGNISGEKWIPWFCSKLMGDMLLRVMSQHPNRRLLVLCGHTHSSGIFRPLPNITVLTGGAKYYAPDLAGILELEGPTIGVKLKTLDGWVDVAV